jgi:hypothetical protein
MQQYAAGSELCPRSPALAQGFTLASMALPVNALIEAGREPGCEIRSQRRHFNISKALALIHADLLDVQAKAAQSLALAILRDGGYGTN